MPPHVLPQAAPYAANGTERETVLIVDDDPHLVEALARRLQQQGFEVIFAVSGREGRETAHRDHPDLIVLDQRLPDTDGFTVCQELADAPDTCSTPVILLSGMSRPDIIRRSRAEGCQYFVRKPYDPNAMVTLIRHSIDESRRGRRPVAPTGD